MAHFRRGQELRLLDVDRGAGAGEGENEIGLAAEEGGQLQHIGDLRHRLGLAGLVDIGEDGNPEPPLHLGEQPQPLGEARPAKGGDGGAVGLVEARLENPRYRQFPGGLGELAGHGHHGFRRFEHIHPADKNERPVIGEADFADGDLDAAHG